MPTYDYKCKACNHIFHEMYSISERKYPEQNPCPSCSKVDVEQVILNSPAIKDKYIKGGGRAGFTYKG